MDFVVLPSGDRMSGHEFHGKLKSGVWSGDQVQGDHWIVENEDGEELYLSPVGKSGYHPRTGGHGG